MSNQTVEQIKTKEVIDAMLKENTGRALCDSGGYGGRMWERNQNKDFEKQQICYLRFSVPPNDGDPSTDWHLETFMHNIYHWLAERGTFDESMQKALDAFAELPDNKELNWLSLQEAFVEHLEEITEPRTITHPWGTPKEGPNFLVINTYNHESLLSQVMQYVAFSVEEKILVFGQTIEPGDYVLISIHGGADVRGGYTAPKAFLTNFQETCNNILEDRNGSIYCEGSGADEPHWWDTYDGDNFDTETEFEFRDMEATSDPELKGKGYLYIDKEGNGHCPKCGGLLVGYF